MKVLYESEKRCKHAQNEVLLKLPLHHFNSTLTELGIKSRYCFVNRR